MVQKIFSFFSESKQEMLENVTWSPFSELQRSAWLVLVACLIFAIIIGVMDFSFEELLKIVYSFGK